MMLRVLLLVPMSLSLVGAPMSAEENAAPFTIKFHEPRTEISGAVQPLDPTPRIQYQYVGAMAFGLTVDQRVNLCCGAGAIRTTFKIDDRIWHPNVPGAGTPLPPDRFGKPRRGLQTTFIADNVHITQILEVIPSRPANPQTKRQLDTVLVRYLIDNRSGRPRSIGTRVRIDTMCGNNDGALFAAPTRPEEVLNGTELKDKTLPEYVQILERPDLKNPGFVGHYTLKLPGDRVGPDRFLCTAHAGGDNGWDAPVILSNGDSDAIMYWSPREVKPGKRLEMAYAYGRGVASIPENAGRVKISLGGSFEPGKLFSVQAFVEEPVVGQTIALELPTGMTLVEGPALQPVVPASAGTGMVVWKARVDMVGEFAFGVRSSNGIHETRTVTVARAMSQE